MYTEPEKYKRQHLRFVRRKLLVSLLILVLLVGTLLLLYIKIHMNNINIKSHTSQKNKD